NVKTATARWWAQAGDAAIGEIGWPPSGDRIAAVGRDLPGPDVRDGSVVLRRAAGGPRGLAVSAGGGRPAVPSRAGGGALIGLAPGEPVATFDDLGMPINSLAFANDGGAVFAGGNRGRVFRLSLHDGAVAPLRRCAQGRDCAALAICGGKLLTFGAGGHVEVGDREFDL